jgi:hypothetical protein
MGLSITSSNIFNKIGQNKNLTFKNPPKILTKRRAGYESRDIAFPKGINKRFLLSIDIVWRNKNSKPNRIAEQ